MASSTLFLLLLFLLLSLSASSSAMKQTELDSMLSALRSRGYTRFSTAIATSDVLYDVVSSHSSAFTFFAPTDPSLYALDMAGGSGEDYTRALRCHVIPLRLTTNLLRKGPASSSFDTLVQGKPVRVTVSRRRTLGDDVITVNGVLVSLPGLFYSRNVAVHGLAGILNFTTPTPPPTPPPAANNSDASGVMNQTNLANISDVFQNDTIEPVVSDPGYAQHFLPPPVYAAAPPPEVTGMKLRSVDPAVYVEVSGSHRDEGFGFGGVMEMLQADFEKWDEGIFDCLLSDDFVHVSTAPGYLYTRQQPHASMPPSCVGLHQFLHLEHF